MRISVVAVLTGTEAHPCDRSHPRASARPRFRRRLLIALALALAPPGTTAAPAVPYAVVGDYPHRSQAFTQGLIVDGDALVESSGHYGRSFIARWQLDSDGAGQRVALPKRYFGEGLTRLGNRLFVLTWRERRGLIFDAETLAQRGSFRMRGEGWGLTDDGRQLIMSNGSDELRWLDAQQFAITRRLKVTDEGTRVDDLNELEWLPGDTPVTPNGPRLLANRWGTDLILVIDPSTGHVTGELRLGVLYPRESRVPNADVLNGVAFDPADHTLLVTGKWWPRVYRLSLPAGLP